VFERAYRSGVRFFLVVGVRGVVADGAGVGVVVGFGRHGVRRGVGRGVAGSTGGFAFLGRLGGALALPEGGGEERGGFGGVDGVLRGHLFGLGLGGLGLRRRLGGGLGRLGGFAFASGVGGGFRELALVHRAGHFGSGLRATGVRGGVHRLGGVGS